MANHTDEDLNRFWELWRDKYPGQKEDFEHAWEKIRSMVYKNQKMLSDRDFDRIFSQVMAFKEEQDKKADAGIFPMKRRFYHSTIFRVAAVLLLCFSFSFGIYYIRTKSVPDSMPVSANIIEETVPMGEKRTIRLSDGSVVKLNSGSRLRYADRFTGSERIVSLEGEAYFDIAKDKTRPFIINTGAVNTKVLGTSFNLRSYKEEENIEVALVSGSVEINDAQKNVILLEPSEAAVYSKKAKTLQKKAFNARLVTSWKDNILVFEKDPMQQVISKLERWYGVNFRLQLKSPIVGLYSGEYRDESLSVVLSGIGYASGFQYKIEGNLVTIKN